MMFRACCFKALVLLAWLTVTTSLSSNCRPNHATPQKSKNGHRRAFLLDSCTKASSVVAIGASVVLSSPSQARAVVEQQQQQSKQPFRLQVHVKLPKEVDPQLLLGPDTALYVTARPATTENISAAVLNGTRGRAPPVLSARSTTPMSKSLLNLVLTEQDVTVEGAQFDEWKNMPLIVSARLDTDGIAATRNATDLVGRVTDMSTLEDRSVELVLQGRGLTGKMLTK